jgi:hypothetical protein
MLAAETVAAVVTVAAAETAAAENNLMNTNLSTIIAELTKIQQKFGDIHVRIMGEPISGISVRKTTVWYSDRKEESFEANILGRAFDGVLVDCEKKYNNLKPIEEVKKITGEA